MVNQESLHAESNFFSRKSVKDIFLFTGLKEAVGVFEVTIELPEGHWKLENTSSQ